MSSERSVGYKNCPECKSNKIVKNGFQSKKRRYRCKDCGKNFKSKSQSSRKNNSVMELLIVKKNHFQN